MRAVAFICYILLVISFKVAQGVIWPCQSKEDCSLAEGAICSSLSVCECEDGYVLSEDLTRCLSQVLYGEECEESVQCSHMPSGAKCRQGVCQCAEGYNYARGRCRKLSALNGPCKENWDCYFGYDPESVACTSGQCTCANGYYKRSENFCRRKSMGVGEPCVVNEDCNLENGMVCINFKCDEPAKRRYSKDVGIQTSFEGFQAGTQKGREKRDEEDIELTPLSSETESYSKRLSTGEKCSTNGQPCDGLDHSLCANNICVCKIGYYAEDDICKAELGEIAETAEECDFEYNEESKLCLCDRNYFYEPGLRDCRKPIVPIEGRCTSNSQCSPMGASYCREERPRICECFNYAKLNEERQLCIPTEGLGAYCETNDTCHLPNTICSNEHVCVCKENFVENNGVCAPSIAAECQKDEDCVVENSVCLSPEGDIGRRSVSVCQCKKGYVQFENKCYKEVTDPNEECEDKSQCKPLLGNLAQCIERKCSCGEKYHLNSGKCQEKKKIGDACKTSSECYAELNQDNIECRNAVCRCKYGYTTDIEKKICIVPKKNSSGRPSPLKIITIILITSAFLVTSAAIRQAYF